MATSLGGASISVSISAVLQNVLDGRTIRDVINFNPNHVLTDGTGAGQAKSVFFDRRTLAASASEELDLAGGISDSFGNVLTFSKIRALLIRPLQTNTNNVLVGGAASNGWTGPFANANDILVGRPGGILLVTAPDTAGYAVVAGTGDRLKLENSGAGSSVSFDVLIIGTT